MLFHFWEYFLYFLNKEDQHSIHSPYFFKLYQDLKAFLANNKKGKKEIELQRKKFLSSKEQILRKDYGAGSRWSKGEKQKVATIAKSATSPIKSSLLFQFLCKLTPANTVLDLGTSLGINTAYLSSVTKGDLYTFEGDPALAHLAGANLNFCPNVNKVVGNIDNTLGKVLEGIEWVDFVLIDANHRYQPTLDYFNAIAPKIHKESIVVIGDIHWSKEMKQAWEEIKDMPSVSSTIDFFDCGVLFFNNYGNKENYILAL